MPASFVLTLETSHFDWRDVEQLQVYVDERSYIADVDERSYISLVAVAVNLAGEISEVEHPEAEIDESTYGALVATGVNLTGKIDEKQNLTAKVTEVPGYWADLNWNPPGEVIPMGIMRTRLRKVA